MHQNLSKEGIIANINFYQKRTFKTCNMCGIFCCNCRTTKTERKLKVNILY
jgi:hypothetical protein